MWPSPHRPGTRIRGAAKGQPRTPLQATTKSGHPRCQYWDLRDGKQWQCTKPARRGFRTCPVHGAGYAKRERQGHAINPKAASVRTGEYASVEAKAAFLARYPEIGALYDQHVADPHFLDLRPQIAWAKTLAEHYLRRADLKRTKSNMVQGHSEILLAIEALRHVARIARDFAAIEKARGPILHDDLQRLVHTFGVALARFVPADRIEECKEFVRAQLTGPLVRAALGGDHPRTDAPGDGEPGPEAA